MGGEEWGAGIYFNAIFIYPKVTFSALEKYQI